MNYQNFITSGEKYVLKRFIKGQKPIVIDIGANEGKYAQLVKSVHPESKVFSFEPHPKNFFKLQENARHSGFMAFNLALDKSAGSVLLYDYQDMDGSPHASIYKGVIEDVQKGIAVGQHVSTTSLDIFFAKHLLVDENIDLLKIDAEGNELNILVGGQRFLSENRIKMIQFEFSQLNIISRTFLKDFFDFLKQYNFYRILRCGLIPLDPYDPTNCEIYLFQNILAIHKRYLAEVFR